MKQVAKITLVFLTSWMLGVATYIGSLALFFGQTLSSGDLWAVLFWSLLAYSAAFLCFYLPALSAMGRCLGGTHHVWPFPALGVLLGIVPTGMIVSFWGGGLSSLLSPEAFLFYSMFTAIGLTAGIGYALIWARDPAA